MKNIYILCDSSFLNHSSGINTFVVNLFIFIEKNFKSNVYLVTDRHFLNQNFYNKLNTLYIDTKNLCMTSKDYYQTYSDDMVKFLSSNNIDNNSIFIANSLATTITLDKLSNLFPNCTYISYTHIGDLIHSDENSYDFSLLEKQKYIEILKNNNKINICTQSKNLKLYLENKYNFKNILVAEEIVEINKKLLDFPKISNNDILIIASNYKRKRLDIMLKAISKTNYNVKLICKDINGYYDIKKIIKEYGIKINIVQNIPNDKMIIHIKDSKLLLHISDIEFFPYSVLEASFFIPTLINSNTIWGKLYPDELTYKVNSQNPEIISKEIEKCISLNNLNNYDIYYNKCIQSWKKIIGDISD